MAGFKLMPIIIFHSIGGRKSYPYNISLEAFERQMLFLKSYCEVMRLRDLPTILSKKVTSNQKLTVFITFDDAQKSIYTHARSILQKFDFPYTIFVPTQFIGNEAKWIDNTDKIMTREELIELRDTGLVDFGSHTDSHVSLGSISAKEIYKELLESRIKLCEILETKNIDLFSYPYGGFNDFSRFTLQILRKAGFKIALTTIPGVMNSERHLLKLRRISFNEEDDEKILASKLSGNYEWYSFKDRLAFSLRYFFNNVVLIICSLV
jgi:peptidoglycan/xylan/chitin deacetylase (PgdA/CDA1 family)